MSGNEKLSGFVDGELSVEERKELEQLLTSDKKSAARVNDLRAGSALTRLAFEMLADEEDFKDFSNQVLAKLTPEKLPLFERLKLTVAETFTYQRPMFVTAMATAMVVAIAAVPVAKLAFDKPDGYAADNIEVESVSVSDAAAHGEAKVRPVVLETEKGDALIWTVEEPAEKLKDSKTDERNEELDGEPPSNEKKAGEL